MKGLKATASGVLLFISLFSWGQKDKIFPTIEGSTLDEKAITVPKKNGKYSVVAIAFHRKAEDDLKKWLNPLYESFIGSGTSSGTQLELAEVNDVNFVFIPVIAGLKRIKEDFKKGTDKGFWPYIMDTEKSDVKGLEKALNVEDDKIPYFFVLNPEGKILTVQKGIYQSSKLEKLEAAVE